MLFRSSTQSHEKEDDHADIASLEKELIAAVSSKASLNRLADLVDLAYHSSDAQVLLKAVYALYRVFVVVISNNLLLNVAGSDESRAVRTWLQEKLNSFVSLLTSLLKDENSILKVRLAFHTRYLCSTFSYHATVEFSVENIDVAAKTSFDIRQQSTELKQHPTATVPHVSFPSNCSGTITMPSFPPCLHINQEKEGRRGQ